MSDLCRLCSSPLRGSRRRWLFGGSGSLSALFSRVLGAPVSRSRAPPSPLAGKGRPEDFEFLCGKCVHSLNLFHRYDLVASRMRQLYAQRSARLLSEKDRLGFTLRNIHARAWGLPLADHPGSCPGSPWPERPNPSCDSPGSSSLSETPSEPYQLLLARDRSLWEHESWWEESGEGCPRCSKGHRCHGCSSWRVSDAHYETVCSVPRRRQHSRGEGSGGETLPRSKSLGSFWGGGSSRGSLLSFSTTSLEQVSLTGEEEMGVFWEPSSLVTSSPPSPTSSSMATVEEALRTLKGIGYSPVKTPARCRIPVRRRGPQEGAPEAGGRRAGDERRSEPLGEETVGDWDVYMGIGEEVCRTHLSRSVRIRDTISWLQEQLKLSRSSQTQEDSPKDQEELIRELVLSLHCKEQVLEDCLTLLLTQPGTSDPGRDPVVGNLREREEELKREKDEEAELARQRDAEVQRLQLELREKDGDLARLQRVLCENQDTITAVRDLLGEKEFAVQQLEVALGSAVRSAASQDALRLSALREKDALIFAMQGALSSSNQDVEALADSLLSQGLDDLGGCIPPAGSPGPLLSQLQEKGRLLSQAHTESQRQSAQHQRDIHELLSALSDSQTLLQEQLRHCRERLQGGAPEVQRLRDALRLREAELRAERQRHACDMRETHTEMSQLYGSVRERDKHTQKLLQESQSRDEAIRRLQETLSPGGGMKATL